MTSFLIDHWHHILGAWCLASIPTGLILGPILARQTVPVAASVSSPKTGAATRTGRERGLVHRG